MPLTNQLSSGRTPLFRRLRTLLQLARSAQRRPEWQAGELLERQRTLRLTRRRFLAAAGTAVGTVGLVRSSEAQERRRGRTERNAPTVVIVGAGIAGLTCAYNLRRSGLKATIYEAASFPGGRIQTATDELGPGLTTELGGEYIDSIHRDMLQLVRDFDLPLIDTLDRSEAGLIRDSFFFDGRHRSEEEVIEGFLPIAAQMDADLRTIRGSVTYDHPGRALDLDQTSIAEYLDRIDTAPFVKELLNVAYLTEYGLETDEQSCLNLLFLIATDVDHGFDIFGESDERYKIRGGNQQVIEALAEQLPGQIAVEHRLTAVFPNGRGFQLIFDRAQASPLTVKADIVVLCIPFSILRHIDLRVPLPPVKRLAIDTLGYGTNAKVMVGVQSRLWRGQGRSGYAFTDEAFQNGWDNSQQQPGTAGGFTFYLGGDTGLSSGQGSALDQAARFLPGAERVFPGMLDQFTGTAIRFHWPTYPLTLGSYACYRPGQWTEIAGSEGLPVKNLLFAGEHCSYDFQGYMNGGAQTGRLVARQVRELAIG